MKYFMVYQWTRAGMGFWKTENKGTNDHPINEIVKMREIGKKSLEEYRLLNWQKVDPDEVLPCWWENME